MKSSPTACEQTKGNIHVCAFCPIISTYSLQVVMWKFQLSLIHFLKLFGFAEFLTPTPGDFHLFCGGSLDIFWNYYTLLYNYAFLNKTECMFL